MSSFVDKKLEEYINIINETENLDEKLQYYQKACRRINKLKKEYNELQT